MASSFALVPMAVLAAAFPVVAQWSAVPAVPGPANRAQCTLTPLPNGELLLFGGDVANPAATEWSWNGIRWAPVTTPVPRRQNHAMARNDATGELLLFGGDNAVVGFTDTWVFANGTWTQRTPTTVPQVDTMLRMAWNPKDGAMILVGSATGIGEQTWRYDGTDWVQLNQITGISGFDVFTDTVRGEVCLFGVGNGPAVEVRRLVDASWVPVVARVGASVACRVAFDRDRGRAIARGIAGATRFTYEYDGLHLVQLEGGSSVGAVLPPFAMAYHEVRREVVFVDAPQPQVERWSAGAVPMSATYGTPCVAAAFQLGLAPGDSPQPGGVHRLQAGGSAAAITLSVLGLSHVQNLGLPLPQTIPLGSLGCQLRVEALLVDFLGAGLPATRIMALPNSPLLLGARYDAQFVQLDATGVSDASNGIEVQIGLPLPENVLLETFATAARRDAQASGDTWANGGVTAVAIGGDGRHGSFDPSLGAAQGGGVFVWNTDDTTLPASVTLRGVAETVTDGRFFFTDFVVPAGVTVRFVGSAPAQVLVRGVVDVQGTVSVDAADMPFYVSTTGASAGQRVSTFHARGMPATQQVLGQPGGNGGAGGGRGGDGGRECPGTGPVFVAGVNVTNGQPGQDVRTLAGHAYAGAAMGTGGQGSAMHPASGLAASAGQPFIIATLLFRDEFSPGGGGGGYLQPGGAPALPMIPPPAITQPNSGPLPAPGVAFPLLPYPANPPAGYSSLQHYLVGGSGGGGGGSHTFGIATALTDVFMAGHGGSGGGGAIALRAGGDVAITGSLTSRGGRGVLVNGDNPVSSTADVDFGASSPGGGGSGGSVLVQSARSVIVNGAIDTSGGAGSRTGNVAIFSLVPTQLNVQSQAGAGATGFYRLEAGNTVTFAGTGVPVWAPATQSGALTDQDSRTGSRSTWLLPTTTALPFYLRYELVADVAGQTLLFSDDPAVSTLAASNPNGPVLLRFQGARLDPVTGGPAAGSIGAWRTQLAPGAGSLNGDRATLLRFDLVLDKAQGSVVVRELRVLWR